MSITAVASPRSAGPLRATVGGHPYVAEAVDEPSRRESGPPSQAKARHARPVQVDMGDN
jgi:hypothetical protein